MNPADLTHTLAFYGLALVSIVAALFVVGARRIFRAAVALAVVLVCGAGFYILLNYDFIAGVQLLVYVGGIVILIVFAVMLTSSLEVIEQHPTKLRVFLGFLSAVAFCVTALWALSSSTFSLSAASATQPTDIALSIGKQLLDYGANGYVMPFEIISLLLLAAVIGAIVVSRNPRKRVNSPATDKEGGAS